MNSKRRLIIVGGGGFGREVYQYALDVISADTSGCDFICVAGFLDDSEAVATSLRRFDVDFVEPIDGHRLREDCVYVVAVGDARRRRAILNRLDRNTQWANVIHPTAYLAPSATLGKGIILAPFSFVGIKARLGDHTVLNTYASCGHDSTVGSFSVLSPYAVINGNVELGEEVFMGTHATVIPSRKVGWRCSLSAGAVITHHVEPGFFMFGNPAKGRRMYELDS